MDLLPEIHGSTLVFDSAVFTRPYSQQLIPRVAEAAR